MCLYIPSSRKRRYPPSAYEDPRPRKRRVTYQQLPAHVRYEPLRGHGVKRDPPSAVAANGTLRGHGAKRDGLKQQPELKVHFAMPVMEQPVQSRPAAVRQRQRHSSKSHHSEHRRKERESRDYSHRQYRSSLSSAQENPLYMRQTQMQTPVHDYRIPASYYLDLCAVRAATNEALQATSYEPSPPAQDYHHLRRQPAYSRLRYQY